MPPRVLGLEGESDVILGAHGCGVRCDCVDCGVPVVWILSRFASRFAGQVEKSLLFGQVGLSRCVSQNSRF